VGIDRQSRRSLVLGGALVVAILCCAAVIAMAAKPAEPQPPFSIDVENGTGRADISNFPTNDLSTAPDASAGELALQVSGTANGADPFAAPDPVSEDTKPTADHGPATVRQLTPGDTGFGWPSTAFGSVSIGSGT
jgi:hypothetical protein